MSALSDPITPATRSALEAIGVVDDDATFRFAISALGAERHSTVRKVIADAGPEVALAQLLEETGHQRAERLNGMVLQAAKAMEASALKFLRPGDVFWPSRFIGMPDSPIALFVRGNYSGLRELDAVAIIGARAATSRGLNATTDIAGALAREGRLVVSGAAFGVDAAAHRAALAEGAPTIAFLACGADIAYPAEHRQLLNDIALSGAVVSEVAPGGAPIRARFLDRNRLIAGFAHTTIVTEAAATSGSMNTVGHAHRMGRALGAVPGWEGEPGATGPFKAIIDFGASPVHTRGDALALARRGALS